jgi:hypothetical protein
LRSLLTIASSDDSTTLARWRAVMSSSFVDKPLQLIANREN